MRHDGAGASAGSCMLPRGLRDRRERAVRPDTGWVGEARRPGAVNEKELKVTDKRMFTPEGELREEYRFLRDAPAPAVTPAPAAAPPAAAPPAPPPATSRTPASAPPPVPSAAPPPSPAPDAGGGRLEIPGTPPGFGGPSFFDLVGLLAEPVSIYLGDLPLPDGRSAEDLEMARLHIDLLDVLRQKTMGNLSAQESAFLEDLLYRLRLRYVRKRG
jgi:hypothetical protein